MKYNLKPIDDLINENWGEESGVEKIVKEIRDTAFGLRTEEETKLYLQKHQFALNQSKDKCVAAANCDKVLYFLETYFWNYLDSKSPISDQGKQALYRHCELAIGQAVQLLPNLLSKKLWHQTDVLLNPLKVHCTIDRANYLKAFWESWPDYFLFHEEHTEDNFISFLISQNFNSPSFYGYVLECITKETNNADDPLLQKQLLEKCLKKYCTGPKRIDLCHTPSMTNVFDMLERWLLVEIKKCKKKQRSYDPRQTTLVVDQANVHKIEISLSVSQLACLFRIMNQTDIITNEVHREMLETVSKTFKTKKTENIALESLYNKFFNIEAGTKDSMKQVLKQLLRELDQ